MGSRNRGSRAGEKRKSNHPKRNAKTWLPLFRRRVSSKTSLSADRRKHFYISSAAKRNLLPELMAGLFEQAREIREAPSDPLFDLALVKAAKWLCKTADKMKSQESSLFNRIWT